LHAVTLEPADVPPQWANAKTNVGQFLTLTVRETPLMAPHHPTLSRNLFQHPGQRLATGQTRIVGGTEIMLVAQPGASPAFKQ
jgi:hypothetical protein